MLGGACHRYLAFRTGWQALFVTCIEVLPFLKPLVAQCLGVSTFRRCLRDMGQSHGTNLSPPCNPLQQGQTAVCLSRRELSNAENENVWMALPIFFPLSLSR